MLENDIPVAPGIRQEKFERNVRKKRYSTPKIITRLVDLCLLILILLFIYLLMLIYFTYIYINIDITLA